MRNITCDAMRPVAHFSPYICPIFIVVLACPAKDEFYYDVIYYTWKNARLTPSEVKE